MIDIVKDVSDPLKTVDISGILQTDITVLANKVSGARIRSWDSTNNVEIDLTNNVKNLIWFDRATMSLKFGGQTISAQTVPNYVNNGGVTGAGTDAYFVDEIIRVTLFGRFKSNVTPTLIADAASHGSVEYITQLYKLSMTNCGTQVFTSIPKSFTL